MGFVASPDSFLHSWGTKRCCVWEKKKKKKIQRKMWILCSLFAWISWVFIVHYHNSSWCVCRCTSCYLQQFFGHVGSLTAQWTPVLSLDLPALPKYAMGPGSLVFPSKLWSASQFSRSCTCLSFSLLKSIFPFNWHPYPTFSWHTTEVLTGPVADLVV